MTKNLLLFFILSVSFHSYSQLKGRIVDQKNTPIPYVNVYIENTYSGTASNDLGFYELNLEKPGNYVIIFQSLGYKTEKRVVTISEFPFKLDVQLTEEEISLNEVVINSEDNPADVVIKMAIEMRQVNLKKITSYTADFYSRGLIKIENAPEKIFGQSLDEFLVGLDSTRSGILYLSETISKVEFLQPDKLKEKIIASKVSGDNNGFSFNTASDVNINFYNNTITLGNKIISPISDYAFNYYRYKLEGLFYDDKGNLINKIKVIPRRSTDPIFSGYIYIVDGAWSIYAVELGVTGTQAQIPPAEVITINQNFSYSEQDKVWVLISQGLDFGYSLFGLKGNGRYTAVYSNYNFGSEISRKSFGKEILSFADAANKKDSLYWQKLRPVPLTDEEVSDYLVKDSIQTLRKSQPYLDSIDTKNNKYKITDILLGYNYTNSFENWSLGYTSPLSSFQFNTIQGFNPKLNLYFRKKKDEYRRYYQINTTLNYGLSDERLRATGSFTYKFNNIKKPFLIISGGNTVQQFNSQEPISPLLNSISSLFFENNFLKIYDKTFAEALYTQEIVNGFSFYSTLSYERRKPLSNTTDYVFINDKTDSYTSNNPLDPSSFDTPFKSHNIAKFNLDFKFNFDQEYMSYPDSKISIPNSKYPTLYLGYVKGFASSHEDYNYDQLKARLTQSFFIGNKGEFKYNLKAGKFFKSNGMSFMDFYHPNANQTHVGTSSPYLNVFNNLPYYELSTNTSYFELHAEHDFKSFILGKIPLLNKLNFNLVLGGHVFATEHLKPYQEYSIGIDNIGFKKFRFLRLDYVRSYQNGFQSDALIFGLKFLNLLEK